MFTIVTLSLSTIAALVLAGRTIWALRRFSYRPLQPVERSLPTVSVCVAARNETHALAQCLERVLASDYPKLEILVLDDSSTDDTSLIIKSFARAGVRFVPGKPLPDGWLGKNHAYQTLIDEASGEYVLFLDVDTTIGVTTISQLVNRVLAKNKAMISVLPRRADSHRASAIFGTMRYYWELLLGTRTHPPAASALWMVRRTALAEAGIGLSSYGLSVRPERHLAGELHCQGVYCYLVGTAELGVGYEKRLHSQYETALRLYYPASGRTIAKWLAATGFMALLIAPLVVVLMVHSIFAVSVWALALVLLVAITFGLFVHRTYGKIAWWLRIGLGPFLVVQEFVLLTLSHIQYRRNRVTWKGRAVAAQPLKHDALALDE